MPVIALKCPNCRGDLELDSTREFGFCQYCGTKIMIQEEMVNIVNNLNGSNVNNSYLGQTTVNNYSIRKETSGQHIYPIIEEGHYEGPMADGKPHGKGVFFWPGGWRYEGDFVNGVIEGYGIKTNINTGETYEGEFKNNLRCGRGKYTNKGMKYDGDFEDDKFTGQGVLEKDGFVFSGRFIDGILNGPGEITGIDSDFREQGTYCKNRLNGPGERHWKGGDWCKAYFINGTPTGLGEYHWADGDWWEGSFDEDGHLHGVGTLHMPKASLRKSKRADFNHGKRIDLSQMPLSYFVKNHR